MKNAPRRYRIVYYYEDCVCRGGRAVQAAGCRLAVHGFKSHPRLPFAMTRVLGFIYGREFVNFGEKW